MNPYRKSAAIGLSAIAFLIIALFAILMETHSHKTANTADNHLAAQPKGKVGDNKPHSFTIVLAGNSAGQKPGKNVQFYLSVHPIGFQAHRSNNGHVAFKGKGLVPVMGKIEGRIPTGNAYRYRVPVPSSIWQRHAKRVFVAASYPLYQARGTAPAGIYSTSLVTITP